jgi:hypothetical protein
MKLRSGKIINILPWQIEKKLNSVLTKFKILLADDEQLALELIQLISFADSIDTRHIVHEKVKETSNFYNEGFKNSGRDLLGICGDLLMLVLGKGSVYRNNHIHMQPVFHEIIQEKIWGAFNWENFNDAIAINTDQADYNVSLIETTDQTSNDDI